MNNIFGRFWQKFILYAGLPEMKIFWYFLPLILIIFIIEIFYLPVIALWFSAGFFIILASIILINNLRLAVSNLEIKIERNETSSIISSLNSGIIAYDPNFKVLIFNKAAEQIFNLKSNEVIGRNFSPENIKEQHFKLFIQTLFPSLAPAIAKRSDPGVYPQIIDISFNDPKIELRVVINKIIDPSGNLLGFFKIITDRTREVGIFRSKSEFIAVAAHQLRTPLTALHWTFENLSNESLNDDQRQLVNAGLESSSYVLKIVNDLLDISQMEEGKFGYSFEKIEISKFIKDIIDRAKKMSDMAGIKIYFQKPAEAIEVNIDSQKLEMVLFNLIDNAIRYNIKNGQIIISVEKQFDKPYIQISVKDTGIGIPQENLQKLFTKFFRAENATRLIPNGSGLGLYIAKNIIRRHGGEIWTESEINRGSIFYFTLPTDQNLIPLKEIIYEEE